MADFFGFNNLLQTLGFRTAPIRTYDDYTMRAAAAGTKTRATEAGTGKTAKTKSFDAYLAENMEATKEMSLEEFKEYVNRMIATLQVQDVQQKELSVEALQTQMQMGNMYAGLLQNSLQTSLTSSLSSGLFTTDTL